MLVAATPVSAAPAAAADAFVVQGRVNPLPGLTVVPAAQSFYFAGVMTLAGTNGVLTRVNCNWTGNDISGDVAEEVGLAAGACGPIALQGCVIVRVGTAWFMNCVTTAGEVVMHGVWVLTQQPPSVIVDAQLTAVGSVVLP